MKKILAMMAVGVIVLGTVAGAQAIQVSVTYTGDNIIGAWYQDGAGPIAQGQGANFADWTKADTAVVDLSDAHPYQFVWQVMDIGVIGGFLGQIDIGNNGSVDLVTNSSWEVSQSIGDPTNFNAPGWNWQSASTYSIGNGDGEWSWFGPVEGIASNAQWIWGSSNPNTYFQMAYVRVTFNTPAPVPEPSTILLLGSGLLGLVAYGRKRTKEGL